MASASLPPHDPSGSVFLPSAGVAADGSLAGSRCCPRWCLHAPTTKADKLLDAQLTQVADTCCDRRSGEVEHFVEELHETDAPGSHRIRGMHTEAARRVAC